MSADNGYMLRRNSAGKLVLQIYFASADEDPPIDEKNAQVFDTVEEALEALEEYGADTEYGLTVAIREITYASSEARSKSPNVVDGIPLMLHDGRVIGKCIIFEDEVVGRTYAIAELDEKFYDKIIRHAEINEFSIGDARRIASPDNTIQGETDGH